MNAEEEIAYWKRKYYSLETQYDTLQRMYNAKQGELDIANGRIKQELEPRLARERRSYDNWVTNAER